MLDFEHSVVEAARVKMRSLSHGGGNNHHLTVGGLGDNDLSSVRDSRCAKSDCAIIYENSAT